MKTAAEILEESLQRDDMGSKLKAYVLACMERYADQFKVQSRPPVSQQIIEEMATKSTKLKEGVVPTQTHINLAYEEGFVAHTEAIEFAEWIMKMQIESRTFEVINDKYLFGLSEYLIEELYELFKSQPESRQEKTTQP